MIYVIMDLNFVFERADAVLVLCCYFLFERRKKIIEDFRLYFTSSFGDDVRKHIVTIGRDTFLVNATVIDVDPKTVDHFEKYIKQTNTSHKAYLDSLKKCMES